MNDVSGEYQSKPLRPNEESLREFWGYKNSGAFSLRENGFTASGISASVIDSNHSTLDGIIVHGAGISQLIETITPDVSLKRMSVSTPKDMLWAIRKSIDTHVSVINISLGTRADKTRGTNEEQMAFAYYGQLLEAAHASGIVAVTASGYRHDRADDSYGFFSNTVVVGGITQKGQFIESNDEQRIDIYAPGEIEIPVRGYKRVVPESHSAAAPYVSAACCAIAQVVGRDPEAIRRVLYSTAQVVDGKRILDMTSLTQELLRLSR